MTPPRTPPTTAPMTPPFTLLRLVVAPMTAPAAAPMAASRLVFLTVTSPGELVVTLVPLLPADDEPEALEPELTRRVVVVRRGAGAVDVRRTLVVAGARTLPLLLSDVAPPLASSELIVSVRGCCCAARERSF